MHKPRGPTNRIVAEGITHPDQVTHTEKKKITDQDALAEQRGRFMYSGRTWQKSLSCRWKEMMSQLMSRLSGSKASYLDRWDLNKTTSGLKLGCGVARKEHRASKRFVSCSRSSWLTLAFCYPTQTTRGGGLMEQILEQSTPILLSDNFLNNLRSASGGLAHIPCYIKSYRLQVKRQFKLPINHNKM